LIPNLKVLIGLRIESADDAKSVVRKYLIGTRSRHGKIASIAIDEEAKGPDDKGTWTVKGAYVTLEGAKEEFDATVTFRGEVTMIDHKSQVVGGKSPSKQPIKGRR
jgi:hypothetical protein